MRYLLTLFSLMNLSLLAGGLQRENIPVFEANASNVIRFAIQKDFSDGSLATRFLSELQAYFGVETFVETGTQLGNTAEKASQIFRDVHTVELLPEFYELAKRKFRNTRNVHLYFGSSGDALPSILELCQGRTLFYLDGHYDGGRSGKGLKNTPILEELAAIRAWGKTDSVIVIDDICNFQKSLHPERIEGTCFADYPDLKDLIDAILAINVHYRICYIPNALLIFPPSSDVTVSSLLSSCTIDRFSTISDLFSEGELLEAERTIGRIQGPERGELEKYFQAYADFETNFGWQSFSSFWMGLLYIQEKNPFRADQIFKRAAQSSLSGWRIDGYIAPRF